MIKQIIIHREYTTHKERETRGSATYTINKNDYESFESFVDKITNIANNLNQMIISISYPDFTIAIITYKEI